MSRTLQFEVIYFDDDLLELRIRAANTAFSGETSLYATHSAPQTLADQIRDFPRSADDVREWELGTFDPNYAGGGVKGKLRCTDRSGHAVATVTLENREEHQATGMASIDVHFEAAELDAFVAELENLGAEAGKHAKLGSDA